jgi:flagellar basal body L-ring protein FlgH
LSWYNSNKGSQKKVTGRIFAGVKKMVKVTNKIIFILCLTGLASCASKEPQKQAMMPAIMPSVNAVAYDRDINKRDPESLSGIYSDESSRDFYQDLRAYKVGDLVTVNIVETSNASKSDVSTILQ